MADPIARLIEEPVFRQPRVNGVSPKPTDCFAVGADVTQVSDRGGLTVENTHFHDDFLMQC